MKQKGQRKCFLKPLLFSMHGPRKFPMAIMGYNYEQLVQNKLVSGPDGVKATNNICYECKETYAQNCVPCLQVFEQYNNKGCLVGRVECQSNNTQYTDHSTHTTDHSTQYRICMVTSRCTQAPYKKDEYLQGTPSK